MSWCLGPCGWVTHVHEKDERTCGEETSDVWRNGVTGRYRRICAFHAGEAPVFGWIKLTEDECVVLEVMTA